jgi:hypothetical protein
MKEKIIVPTEDGTLSINNVSTNPEKVLFSLTIARLNKKKNLLQRIIGAITNKQQKTSLSVFLDRSAGKKVSYYIYGETVAADKEYKKQQSITR